jgi:hypothetical protein
MGEDRSVDRRKPCRFRGSRYWSGAVARMTGRCRDDEGGRAPQAAFLGLIRMLYSRWREKRRLAFPGACSDYGQGRATRGAAPGRPGGDPVGGRRTRSRLLPHHPAWRSRLPGIPPREGCFTSFARRAFRPATSATRGARARGSHRGAGKGPAPFEGRRGARDHLRRAGLHPRCPPGADAGRRRPAGRAGGQPESGREPDARRVGRGSFGRVPRPGRAARRGRAEGAGSRRVAGVRARRRRPRAGLGTARP